MTNVYFSPEKFGLTVVGEAEFSSGGYEFDTFVVWQDDAGQLYYAEDSGCSCPEPFEFAVSVGDLQKVERLQDLIDALNERLEPDRHVDDREDAKAEVGALILAAHEATAQKRVSS